MRMSVNRGDAREKEKRRGARSIALFAHRSALFLFSQSLAFSQVELDVINLHMRFDTSVAKLERHEAEHAQSIKDTADKCAQVQKMSSSLADSIAKRKPIIMQKTEERKSKCRTSSNSWIVQSLFKSLTRCLWLCSGVCALCGR